MDKAKGHIRALNMWLFLGELMDWNNDDFIVAVAEARSLGRGISPEEIDRALEKLTGFLNSMGYN